MKEIEFAMVKYENGKYHLVTTRELQWHVDSDSESMDELFKLYKEKYPDLNITRMIGISYDNE
jgi:hypothetical protein